MKKAKVTVNSATAISLNDCFSLRQRHHSSRIAHTHFKYPGSDGGSLCARWVGTHHADLIAESCAGIANRLTNKQVKPVKVFAIITGTPGKSIPLFRLIDKSFVGFMFFITKCQNHLKATHFLQSNTHH
jgi:hypothetical protein